MPEPTETARKVFEGLEKDYKEFLLSNFELSRDNPDLSMFTCADCPSVAECEFAFDAYNCSGDCLASK